MEVNHLPIAFLARGAFGRTVVGAVPHVLRHEPAVTAHTGPPACPCTL